jgi:protein-disulfide isomerase
MNKTPIFIIGAVLVVAVIGALIYYNSATSAPASNSTHATNSTAPSPKPAMTIPPGAPPGADPPEQMGSPTAAVTLEEFADLQCPSCAAAHPKINEIKSMYGSRIHFIFRNFPLQIPAHDKGYEAALAASAAGMQGKFWDMQNMLFSNQKVWDKDPTYKQIWKGYAQKIGLDVAKWEADSAGMGARNRVEADMARGKAIGINSTPTLFINGTAVNFSDMQVETLKSIIDAELQKAGQSAASNAGAKSDNSNK